MLVPNRKKERQTYQQSKKEKQNRQQQQILYSVWKRLLHSFITLINLFSKNRFFFFIESSFTIIKTSEVVHRFITTAPFRVAKR